MTDFLGGEGYLNFHIHLPTMRGRQIAPRTAAEENAEKVLAPEAVQELSRRSQETEGRAWFDFQRAGY